MSQHRRGYLFGIGAYVSWGFFPLYFKLLRPAGPLEILAHRVVWSALFVAVLLTLARNWRRIPGLSRTRSERSTTGSTRGPPPLRSCAA